MSAVSQEIVNLINNNILTDFVYKYILPFKYLNCYVVSGSANIVRDNDASQSIVTFPNVVTASIADENYGFDLNNFKFFVNGQLIENTAIDEIQQSGSNFVLKVNYNRLNFQLYSTDEITAWGSFI